MEDVTLLIIETENLLRRSLCERLRLQACKILVAETPSEAKRILGRCNVDVVLLGLRGPGRQAMDLLRRIKKTRPLAEVILLNGSQDLSLSIEGMKLGAFDDFLLPLNLDSLVERIREACLQKRAKEKARKSLPRSFQKMMVATTFAEAGEPETALEFIAEKRSSPSSPGKNGKKRKGKAARKGPVLDPA
ncbi:MAG: response regulator [Deltaproteobacteria bacterium]|nr:response regulator [Deltaproteobacteria bacterium]